MNAWPLEGLLQEDAVALAETARPVGWCKVYEAQYKVISSPCLSPKTVRALAASRIVAVWHHSVCNGHIST